LPLEDLRVVLAPYHVDVVRLKRGWRGLTIAGQQSLACEPAAGHPPWHAALGVLGAALAGARGAATSARVVLSDDFVRYLLVPWRTDLRNDGEMEALARIRFREVHGSIADDWEIRLAPTQFGAPYLACAVDRELLRALAALHTKEKLRLAAVRPLLVSAYNRWRRTLAAAKCWFAVCARGQLTVCRIEGGAWRSVRSERFRGELARELQLAVERESLALCVDPAGAALHVYAPEQPRSATHGIAGLKVTVCGPLAGVEPRYAMALA
jgi:hypothetical protein